MTIMQECVALVSRAMVVPAGGPRVPLRKRPGAIAVVSGDRTTAPQFAFSIANLKRPDNSLLLWQMCGGGAVAHGRNALVRRARTWFGAGQFWLLFLDDDEVFDSDLLMRMLEVDRAIVTALIFGRNRPHEIIGWWPPFPVAAHMSDDDLARAFLNRWGGQVRPAHLVNELTELCAAGTGALLVSSEVFDAVADPWFEFGRISSTELPSEDLWFSLKARRAGFRIWLDRHARIGHLNTCAVWPGYGADGVLGPQVRNSSGELLVTAGPSGESEMKHDDLPTAVREA